MAQSSSFELLDAITLLLATLGFLLSVHGEIREWRKERRKVKVVLEFVAFYERTQLRIVNSGQRPVTITKIGMSVLDPRYGDVWDNVPANSLLGDPFYPPLAEGEEYKDPLPAKINDGDQIIMPLSIVVSEMLMENGMKAKINVYDSEGKVYTRYEKKLYNAKWGKYEPIPERWK